MRVSCHPFQLRTMREILTDCILWFIVEVVERRVFDMKIVDFVSAVMFVVAVMIVGIAVGNLVIALVSRLW